jgi:hypothetical protein
MENYSYKKKYVESQFEELRLQCERNKKDSKLKL